MINAGVKEFKNHLSRYLAKVKEGEEILITERGRPVARVVKEGNEHRSICAALRPLIERGVLSLPNRSISTDALLAVKAPGKKASEMVVEDRR